MDEKLLPANLTLLFAYPEAFANWRTPVAAELNDWFVASTNEGAMVFNASCAILDDYTLNQTESDTDDTRTVCDVGEVSNPTFMNFEASLDSLRDESVTDNGLYNQIAELTRAPGRPLILVKRIGVSNETPFAAGQDISLFPVQTDYPQDGVDSGALLTHGHRFIPDGAPVINYEVAA